MALPVANYGEKRISIHLSPEALLECEEFVLAVHTAPEVQVLAT